MQKRYPAVPVVKWAGGKRQLLNALTSLFPREIESYCEPFLGGGAVLFELQPQIAYVNDINSDLIDMYEVIRDNVDELIEILEKYPNDKEYFYSIRGLDRDKTQYAKLTKIQRSARLIYLNRTCYNGLFRVNSAGEFNTPFGYYKNPNIVNADVLKAVNSYFREAQIFFSRVDYAEVLKNITRETFVYLDPPYYPVSSTANFTGYAKDGFNREDQIRLREWCDILDSRGVRFMLSNSATDFIKEQYINYYITTVKAKRTVNSIAEKRGYIEELVVRNYE